MPNWCDNYLIVSGKEKDVKRFVEDNHGRKGEGGSRTLKEADTPPLLFARAVPEPDYNTIKKDITAWRFDNWGTPEEALFRIDHQVNFSTDEKGKVFIAQYYFETAWGPSDNWLEKVANDYPDLRFCFTFGDMAQDFGGAMIYDQGEELIDESGSYQKYIGKEIYNYLDY